MSDFQSPETRPMRRVELSKQNIAAITDPADTYIVGHESIFV